MAQYQSRKPAPWVTASSNAGPQVNPGLQQQPGGGAGQGTPVGYPGQVTSASAGNGAMQMGGSGMHPSPHNPLPPQAPPTVTPAAALPQVLAGSLAPLLGQVQSVVNQQMALQPVTYPTIQSAAQQQHQIASGTRQTQQQKAQQSKQRIVAGVVTKLFESFGVVDDDTVFDFNTVKGKIPNIGDRVLVECWATGKEFPYKYEASRVQVLGAGPLGQAGASSAVPPSPAVGAQSRAAQASAQLLGLNNSAGTAATARASLGLASLQATGGRSSRGGQESAVGGVGGRVEARGGRGDIPRRKRSPPPSIRKRSRSPPPPRRSTATRTPRYVVHVPKCSLDSSSSGIMEIKKKYADMYVPSDFFHANLNWTKAFPIDRPFSVARCGLFHVMSKDAPSFNAGPNSVTSQDDVGDMDHLFSAKVMLMCNDPMEEIYRRSCALADGSEETRDSHVHPTRLLNFLVGIRGKNEVCAVGGAWSPSLDGVDPARDESVLIRTAIRTTRSLTGIDLSKCSHWYRFCEIKYHRSEELRKGKMVPERVETVVIFMPDVWNCMPTHVEWLQTCSDYRQVLRDSVGGGGDGGSSGGAVVATTASTDDDKDGSCSDETKEDGGGSEVATHFSNLSPKTMQVAQLKKELQCRGMNKNGLKSQLVARLTKQLKTEEEQEEKDSNDKEAKAVADEKLIAAAARNECNGSEIKSEEEESRMNKEERERASLEKRFCLPDVPSILVIPSKTAKSGKFDCTVMSLSILLDYRTEDNKEHSFEVSLFAECFNEMLMRDFGFNIYKAILAAPDPPKEEDKKKKKEEKEESRKSPEKEEGEPSDKKKKSDQEENLSTNEKDAAESSGDVKSKTSADEGEKKEKLAMVTTDPDLLLSFVYFDQNHCGYIVEKDVEEIIFSLGLYLSRAQVRKLVQKVVSRDGLLYRKLTDSPAQDSADKVARKEGMEELQLIVDSALAKGNLLLMKKKVDDDKPEGNDAKTKNATAGSMLMHNGALLDVESIMKKLDKNEHDMALSEKKLREYQLDINKFKVTQEYAHVKYEKLKEHSEDVKNKLAASQEANKIMDEAKLECKHQLKGTSRTLSYIEREMTMVLDRIRSEIKCDKDILARLDGKRPATTTTPSANCNGQVVKQEEGSSEVEENMIISTDNAKDENVEPTESQMKESEEPLAEVQNLDKTS